MWGFGRSEKRDELVALIRSYPVLFSDTLSKTHLIEHDIDIGDAKPIKQILSCISGEETAIGNRGAVYV